MRWFIAAATVWAAEKVVTWALGKPRYEPLHVVQPINRVTRDATTGMTIDDLLGEEAH